MSTLFLDETACDILVLVSNGSNRPQIFINLLGCKCLVMHKKEIDIAGVVDEEGFVTRGH